MTDDKMVPEKDLIALKESQTPALETLRTEHSGEITKLTEEHTSAVDGFQSQINTGTTDASRLRATIAELEERVNGSASTADKVKGLQAELKTANEGLKSSQDALASDLRTRLTEDFEIPEEALKDKPVSDLITIRDALASTKKPRSNQYTTGGGAGGEPPTKPREKIRQGLEGGDLKPR